MLKRENNTLQNIVTWSDFPCGYGSIISKWKQLCRSYEQINKMTSIMVRGKKKNEKNFKKYECINVGCKSLRRQNR